MYLPEPRYHGADLLPLEEVLWRDEGYTGKASKGT